MARSSFAISKRCAVGTSADDDAMRAFSNPAKHLPCWKKGMSDDESLERDALVRRAVETALTDKQREAVELFFFEGLSQSEIARRLGVSQQVVQKRLYGAQRNGTLIGGALAKLRTALAPLGDKR
jgi:RNA polymerase sigma factor (sigma-70 family)